jgi:hypothetical protein
MTAAKEKMRKIGMDKHFFLDAFLVAHKLPPQWAIGITDSVPIWRKPVIPGVVP